MTAIMPDTTTISTKPDADSVGLPPPAWATSYDNDHQGSVTWSHKVQLLAVEVDGAERLTVEARLLDYFDASITTGARVERCPPEIRLTRHDAVGEHDNEIPLVFDIPSARLVMAAMQKCIDAVEVTTAATA